MNTKTIPTLLVADTDPASLAQTTRILSGDQYSVFSAICYASALSAAGKLDIDLIICDLSIWTCESGHDLVADIHRIPQREDVPVVFTSSGQGPGVIRRQHDFGAAYHIRKPFDPMVLIEIVERALWMPHLVQTHIKRPHFSSFPATVTQDSNFCGPVSQPIIR